MWEKWFGKKNKNNDDAQAPKAITDFSFLGADMHSHFVPGIDDGAKTIEDSLLLLRGMVDMGFKTIITTPHTMIDFYPNTTETIQNGFELLKQVAAENNITLSLKAASEYYIDESFDALIDKQPLLTIYKNEVLVEFSMLYEPPNLKNVLFKLLTNGYKPIIAHPERYLSFHKDIDKYTELKDRGCLLQLNLLSITGYYGKNVGAVAEKLLANKMYDYCGSDAHHEKHIDHLKNIGNTKVYDLLRSYPFLNNRLCF
ncbi:MAG: hypothetical protein EBX41_03855 [Chitinophagia bacterium]|nr:hypothetical protein [Chitinophagia bacterium]